MPSRALVVGVNSWDNPTAVDDARAVAQLLESRGFEVRTLNGKRATKERIEAHLKETECTTLFFCGQHDKLVEDVT